MTYVNINKKDFGILRCILEDARIPLSQIAHQTKLSREVVNYRLKNLEKNIIKSYQARINLYSTTKEIYTIFLSINGLSEQDALDRLKNLKSVHWIGHGGGKWNYILTFSTSDDISLNDFIYSLFEGFKGQKIKYMLAQHMHEYKDTWAGLLGSEKIFVSVKKTDKSDMDDIDSKILQMLSENARMSNEVIAKALKMTRETVRQRIKSLEKYGIILNYRTSIKPSALGLGNFFINIKCAQSKDDLMKISSELTILPNCIYVCSTAGEISIIAEVYVKEFFEINKICADLREKYPDKIEEIEPIPLFDLDVHEYIPKKKIKH